MGGDETSWREFKKQKQAEKAAKKKAGGDTCAVAVIGLTGLGTAAGIVSTAATGWF